MVTTLLLYILISEVLSTLCRLRQAYSPRILLSTGKSTFLFAAITDPVISKFCFLFSCDDKIERYRWNISLCCTEMGLVR